MIDAVLTRKNTAVKTKITVKSLVSVGIIAAAVVLPQIVHSILGVAGGAQWLPMYLPVLIGGCLLGKEWGIIVGALSPVVSFAFTSLFGNPMPVAERLPYMVAELAVFAFVSGAFSKLIIKNKWFAFPAVISAQIAGRGLFIAAAAVAQNFGGLQLSVVLAQVKTGLAALAIQAVIVPVIVIALREVMIRDGKND
ncbi:MAG: hypothetical protein PUB20_08570 [Clostridia bacterium]|nr:hypothetical protein [Clostridia bacterium]